MGPSLILKFLSCLQLKWNLKSEPKLRTIQWSCRSTLQDLKDFNQERLIWARKAVPSLLLLMCTFFILTFDLVHKFSQIAPSFMHFTDNFIVFLWFLLQFSGELLTYPNGPMKKSSLDPCEKKILITTFFFSKPKKLT